MSLVILQKLKPVWTHEHIRELERETYSSLRVRAILVFAIDVAYYVLYPIMFIKISPHVSEILGP